MVLGYKIAKAINREQSGTFNHKNSLSKFDKIILSTAIFGLVMLISIAIVQIITGAFKYLSKRCEKKNNENNVNDTDFVTSKYEFHV